MAIFMNGEHNCACGRRVCDWSCTTYAKLMSDNIPNTAVGYVPPIKKTNADRIRAKTDEGLAKFLWMPMEHICPYNCQEDPDRICVTCILDWLKEEVEK